MDIWKGAFAPTTQKHRLYTGDPAYHIDLISWEVDGNILFAEMGFKDGTGVIYSYEVEVSPEEAAEMDEKLAIEILYRETHKS